MFFLKWRLTEKSSYPIIIIKLEDCLFFERLVKEKPTLRVGSFLLVLVLEVELHRLVRVVGFKLVDIVGEVRAIGVHGFKHLQVLSVRSLLAYGYYYTRFACERKRKS